MLKLARNDDPENGDQPTSSSSQDERLREHADADAALADAREETQQLQGAADAARRQAVDSQEYAEMLVDIGQALAGEADPVRLAEMIARMSGRAIGARMGAFLSLADPDEGIPLMTAVVCDAEGGEEPPTRTATLPLAPVAGAVLIGDLQVEPPTDPVVRLMRLLPTGDAQRSCLVAPLRTRSGAVLGNVIVADPRPLAFSPRHARILAGVVAIAAQSLENAERFREERALRHAVEERERLARLHGDIGRALTAAIPFEASLARCCTALVNGLAVAYVRIWVLDEPSGTLVLRASEGADVPLAGLPARIPLGATLIGGIAERRMPRVLHQLGTDPGIDQAWARSEGLISFAGYPLVVGEETLGVIGLFARHALSVATVEMLTAASVGLAANLDRHRKDARLAVVADQLRQSNEDLERFTAIASHDLLEPARTVGSFVGLLERRYGAQLDERGRGYVRHAMEASERMGALIRSLLAYSRLAGERTVIAQVALDEAVDDTLANLAMRIAEVGGQIVRGPLPAVLGDRGLLGQLFQNLVANALKFRKPGTAPRIAINAVDAGGEWHVRVADDGIGILPEHRARIFEMFQRLHTEAEYAGSGIGLATCRRIVERLQGRIWVESEPGTGTTFCMAFRKL